MLSRTMVPVLLPLVSGRLLRDDSFLARTSASEGVYVILLVHAGIIRGNLRRLNVAILIRRPQVLSVLGEVRLLKLRRFAEHVLVVRLMVILVIILPARVWLFIRPILLMLLGTSALLLGTIPFVHLYMITIF